MLTEGIANVKIGQALTFGMPKKVFSKSFTKIKLVSVPLLRLKVGPYVWRVKIQCSLHSEALLGSVPNGSPYDMHTIDNQYYVLGKTKGGLISELFFTSAQIFQKSAKELSSGLSN